MNRDERIELKPCPFCGQSAEVICERTDTPFSKHEYLVRCSSVGVCYGRSHRCDDAGFMYREDAIAKWNTRTDREAVLVAVLEHYADKAHWSCSNCADDTSEYACKRSDHDQLFYTGDEGPHLAAEALAKYRGER